MSIEQFESVNTIGRAVKTIALAALLLGGCGLCAILAMVKG
jgi:hypothetical protein